jgi:hypothetical protein
MQKEVLSIDGMASSKEAAAKMRASNVSELMVSKRSDDDAWGIITIMDLVKDVIVPGRDAESVFVYEIMTKPVITIPAQMDIRHAQWRWDFSIAAHGSFFHAPEETLRVLGSAIEIGQEARLKLRAILAKYNAADYQAPDFSSKEKAQQIIGLPFDKLVDEKNQFLKGLKQEWFKEGEKQGIYDPKSREGMVLKTSYPN